MKDKIHGLLVSAISELYESKDLSIEIVKTKSEEHGDWSSNVAMIEAKKRVDNPKELAKKKGYKIASNVSKNLDILVFGEKSGSKLRKAKDLKINILNEIEFLNLIN